MSKILPYLLQCDFQFTNCFGFERSFHKTLCIALQARYHQCSQIWSVRWLMFLVNHLQTVLACRHSWATRAVRRAQCISLNLTAVSCSLQWTLEAEINKPQNIRVSGQDFRGIASYVDTRTAWKYSLLRFQPKFPRTWKPRQPGSESPNPSFNVVWNQGFRCLKLNG